MQRRDSGRKRNNVEESIRSPEIKTATTIQNYFIKTGDRGGKYKKDKHVKSVHKRWRGRRRNCLFRLLHNVHQIKINEAKQSVSVNR